MCILRKDKFVENVLKNCINDKNSEIHGVIAHIIGFISTVSYYVLLRHVTV